MSKNTKITGNIIMVFIALIIVIFFWEHDRENIISAVLRMISIVALFLTIIFQALRPVE